MKRNRFGEKEEEYKYRMSITCDIISASVIALSRRATWMTSMIRLVEPPEGNISEDLTFVLRIDRKIDEVIPEM